MPSTLIDAWMNRPPIIDPAELPTFLEEFDEDDAEDPDRAGERLWSTGHLLTSRLNVDPLETASPGEDFGSSAGSGVGSSVDSSIASSTDTTPDSIHRNPQHPTKHGSNERGRE
jgi:hypothetical protein